MKNLIKVALYQPDIPQNTAAIIRLCACFKTKLDIIGPCGFNLADKRLKRVTMDYKDNCEIKLFSNYEEFIVNRKNERIILMTTKSKKNIIFLSLKKMIYFYLEEKVLGFQINYIKILKINLQFQFTKILDH